MEMLMRASLGLLPPAHPPLAVKPATQACALTGNGAFQLSVHERMLNQLSHTSCPPPGGGLLIRN